MPKTRQQKENTLNQVNEKLENLKGGVLVSFKALAVNEDQKLRSELRKEEIEYEVIKKTLLKKSLESKGFTTEILSGLQDNVALATSTQDEVKSAKILNKFSQDNENYNIVGGFLEGKWIAAAQVIALAKLPSREELIAKTVGTIKAPLSGFVNVLVGNLRGLINVLNGIKDQKV